MSECKHIFNAHAQCQWCHRMKKDIEYEDMKAEIERLSGDAASLAVAREQLLVQADEIKRLLRSHYKIERLRAIINAKLHRRKCHDCGHVGWYADSRTPYCLCDQCRSQDTRLVKVEGQNCEVKP